MRSMRGQRFLSLLLIISMLLSMFPGTALAADPVTVISTPEALAAYSNKSMSGNFQLGADLDMSETEMKPISSLSGSFDGGGHTISNLTVTGNNAGLFSPVSYTHLRFMPLGLRLLRQKVLPASK